MSPTFHPKPSLCEGCPAYSVGKSFVPGDGPMDARVLFVGQGPGEDEAIAGLPFVGPSGRKLDSWCRQADPPMKHLDRLQVRVDNTVRCWLPKNRAPKASEAAYCSERYLSPDIAKMPNLEVVVSVGLPAAANLLGHPVKQSIAGSVLQVEVP